MKQLVLEPIYQPGDTVGIEALGLKGYISLIRFDGKQVEFFVNWWSDSKRHGEWLFAAELSAGYSP